MITNVGAAGDSVGGPSDRPIQEAGEAGVPSVGRTVGPTLNDARFRSYNHWLKERFGAPYSVERNKASYPQLGTFAQWRGFFIAVFRAC